MSSTPIDQSHIPKPLSDYIAQRDRRVPSKQVEVAENIQNLSCLHISWLSLFVIFGAFCLGISYGAMYKFDVENAGNIVSIIAGSASFLFILYLVRSYYNDKKYWTTIAILQSYDKGQDTAFTSLEYGELLETYPNIYDFHSQVAYKGFFSSTFNAAFDQASESYEKWRRQ